MKNQNSSMEVVWLIRDARGLTTNEKAFLFVIASRGIAKTTREKLMQDLNCSTGTITNLVTSLGDKDLINVYPGYWKDGKKTPTAYTIKTEVLTGFVPKKDEDSEGVQEMNDPVQDMNTLVHEVNTPVQEMNEPVHDMATKGTTKVTDKETSKRTDKKGASAPVDSSYSIDYSDSSLSLLREDRLALAFTELEALANSHPLTLLVDDPAPVVANSTPPDRPTPSPFEGRTTKDWQAIRRVRPLTPQETDFLDERASRYQAELRAKKQAEQVSLTGW